MRIALVSGTIILILSLIVNMILQYIMGASRTEDEILSVLIIILIHTSFALGALIYLIKKKK
ncbi:hypothetical protein DL346_22425 [Paenibacillus montanisoli]|uniref:Uncharacterized protein n=1 Tax=Paenibacillus montanisoli TaxID=2081970 RepID=A0A328U4K4_9BACL|nr:hypothetical protein DL346_22425 [Paenibacillus montanisoli]